MDGPPKQDSQPECRVCSIQVEYKGEQLTIGDHIYRIADVAYDIKLRLKQALKNMFLNDDSGPMWRRIFGVEEVIDVDQLIIRAPFGEGRLSELQQQSSFRERVRFIIDQPARRDSDSQGQ